MLFDIVIIIWLVVWNNFVFCHILGIIIPTDSTDFHIVQRGWKPPTSYTIECVANKGYDPHLSTIKVVFPIQLCLFERARDHILAMPMTIWYKSFKKISNQSLGGCYFLSHQHQSGTGHRPHSTLSSFGEPFPLQGRSFYPADSIRDQNRGQERCLQRGHQRRFRRAGPGLGGWDGLAAHVARLKFRYGFVWKWNIPKVDGLSSFNLSKWL